MDIFSLPWVVMRNSRFYLWGFLTVAAASVVALPLVWSQLIEIGFGEIDP